VKEGGGAEQHGEGYKAKAPTNTEPTEVLNVGRDVQPLVDRPQLVSEHLEDDGNLKGGGRTGGRREGTVFDWHRFAGKMRVPSDFYSIIGVSAQAGMCGKGLRYVRDTRFVNVLESPDTAGAGMGGYSLYCGAVTVFT